MKSFLTDLDFYSEEYLKNLIDAASRCECDFDCYCSKNMLWAEDRLEKLKQWQKEK